MWMAVSSGDPPLMGECVTNRKHRYTYRKRWLYSHFWTVYPHLTGRFVHEPQGPNLPWSIRFDDPVMGSTPASGIFHPTPDAHALVVIIHGLGSGPTASYVVRATHEFISAGYAVLRLAHRGADGQAADYYNSALTRGLHEAMACEQLRPYTRRFVLGYSLGGHLALRFAMETNHPALCAVAAVCPPLDLAGCQIALDAPRINLYRRHCLEGLRSTIRGAEARARALGRTLPTMGANLDAIHTIRDWDHAVVVPRFGYRDVDDYYASASAGPRLETLKRPALVVAATHDPMVPIETLQPYLSTPRIHAVVTEQGGHVGFPQDLDLGMGSARGLVPQVRSWFDAQPDPPSRSERNAPDVNWAGYGQYGPR